MLSTSERLTLIVVFFTLSSLTRAEVPIDSPPPIDLMLLPFKKVHEGEPTTGVHGEKSYCYKAKDLYTVYSQNLLGEGYSFSEVAPPQMCIVSKSNINTTNSLGLTVGITKEKAVSLLRIEVSEGDNRIQWSYQRPIHNLAYDDFTTLDIKIENGIVNYVSVFNTVTH